MAALTSTQHASRDLNREVGVGFWNKADADAHARLEQARTGEIHVLCMEPTPGGSHELWFVRKVREEAA